jgi:DTW domain-containing protein YfiP
LKGIIILDGSWKQAKTLWWRNSWLLRLNRVSLNPAHQSLRNQVSAEKLSTLEAAAMTLRLLGEPEALTERLLAQYRHLIIDPNRK